MAMKNFLKTCLNFFVKPIPGGELSSFFMELWDKPTHLIYFLLSILAVWNINTNIVTRMLATKAVNSNLHNLILLCSVLLVSATFIHLCYIYKSLIEAEEKTLNISFFSNWIGKKRFEYSLRFIGMIFLIGAFNKYSAPDWLLPPYLNKAEHLVAISTTLVFVTFLVWESSAWICQITLGVTLEKEQSWIKWESTTCDEIEDWSQNLKKSDSDKEREKEEWWNWIQRKHSEDKEKWRKDLTTYFWCDSCAFVQWVCISVYLIATDLKSDYVPDIAIFISFTSILIYSFYVIRIRVGCNDKLTFLVWIWVFAAALMYHIIPPSSPYRYTIISFIIMVSFYFTILRPFCLTCRKSLI